MKRLVFLLSLFFVCATTFAQFSDTSELNTFIRDTIKDRRPERVTAAQLQRALLGISSYLKPGNRIAGPLIIDNSDSTFETPFGSDKLQLNGSFGAYGAIAAFGKNNNSAIFYANRDSGKSFAGVIYRTIGEGNYSATKPVWYSGIGGISSVTKDWSFRLRVDKNTGGGLSDRFIIDTNGKVTIPHLAGNGVGVVGVNNNGELSFSSSSGAIFSGGDSAAIKFVESNYTVLSTDSHIEVDSPGVTITLPNPATYAGRTIHLSNKGYSFLTDLCVNYNNLSACSNTFEANKVYDIVSDGSFWQRTIVSAGGVGGGSLDAVPTNGSTNGVESNGVFDALKTLRDSTAKIDLTGAVTGKVAAIDMSDRSLYFVNKVDTIYRIPGKDSIFLKINGVTYRIKDSTGSGGVGNYDSTQVLASIADLESATGNRAVVDGRLWVQSSAFSWNRQAIDSNVTFASLVDFDFVGAGVTESPANVWSPTVSDASYGHLGKGNVHLASGTDGSIRCDVDAATQGAGQYIYGFNTSNSTIGYGSMPFGVRPIPGTGYQVFVGGVATMYGTCADGDKMLLHRTGSGWTVERSIDGGANYTLVRAETGFTYTGDAWPVVDLYGDAKIKNIKEEGLIP